MGQYQGRPAARAGDASSMQHARRRASHWSCACHELDLASQGRGPGRVMLPVPMDSCPGAVAACGQQSSLYRLNWASL